MITETIDLLSVAPGTRQTLTVQRFGTPGARPKVYIQAALHADEMPGAILAHHLRPLLAEAEAAGHLRGEVILVPLANPIGLAQRVLGGAIGRFDLADGANFNRHFPRLGPAVAEAVQDRLGEDAAANVAAIRAALGAAAAALPATTPAEDLKRQLLRLAVGADIVLDMHCDSEATMHLYALTPQADDIMPLAAHTGCLAVLLAEESGDDPFDEACSRPWLEVARSHPGKPVPLASLATTLEFRGGRDVDHATAGQDARAVFAYLAEVGVASGPAPARPEPLCKPTLLAAAEPLTAPVAGIVCYHAPVGATVVAGDVICDIVDPVAGTVTPVKAQSAGVLFARTTARFARAGQRLGKIAGTSLSRTGKLLSA